jgi:flagellar export protein FliJ
MSRARVVVRVRQIAEDQAAGRVAIAESEAIETARRAAEAHERTHVHPATGSSGQLNGAALAASAGSAAALMSAAQTATEVAARAAMALDNARRAAGQARAARMMAERLAERREAAVRLEEQRAGQRTLDESVAARHERPA